MLTNVSLLATMMPELRSPMSAMNKPMPTATAEYSSLGIDDTIICRTPAAVKMIKAMPERNTAPSAVSHGIPIPFTTV